MYFLHLFLDKTFNTHRNIDFIFTRFSFCTQIPKLLLKYYYMYSLSWKCSLKSAVSVFLFSHSTYSMFISNNRRIKYYSLLCYDFITYTCYIAHVFNLLAPCFLPFYICVYVFMNVTTTV
jgi:hypothetical protein